MDIRHEFEDSIRSNSHNCLNNETGCVETFVLESEYDTLLSFIWTVRGAGEDVSVEYTVVPIENAGSILDTENSAWGRRRITIYDWSRKNYYSIPLNS